MLTVRGLSASYGARAALTDVSFGAEAAEITAISGPNGAGKSTLLAAIMGLGPAEVCAGEIEIGGTPVVGTPTDEIVHLGASLVPEERNVFAEMSVLENLKVGAFSRSRAQAEHALLRVHDSFPILSERGAQMAGTLSGGEQQMLAIGRALMAEPRLLLLDEVAMGLAPESVARVQELCRKLADSGVAVVLVEPDEDRAQALADVHVTLGSGCIVAPSVT